MGEKRPTFELIERQGDKDTTALEGETIEEIMRKMSEKIGWIDE